MEKNCIFFKKLPCIKFSATVFMKGQWLLRSRLGKNKPCSFISNFATLDSTILRFVEFLGLFFSFEYFISLLHFLWNVIFHLIIFIDFFMVFKSKKIRFTERVSVCYRSFLRSSVFLLTFSVLFILLLSCRRNITEVYNRPQGLDQLRTRFSSRRLLGHFKLTI